MSDDWQVGDLAVCIKSGQWAHIVGGMASSGPAYGEIRAVRRVGQWRSYIVLWLEGYDGDCVNEAFTAVRFRKVRPDNEPCEEEFVTLLKRIKPAKVPS